MSRMSFLDKTVFTAGRFGADDDPATMTLDPEDEEFMEAFYELLDIQGDQQKGEPIVVLPNGPVIYH